jgi:hypothetical protein
MQIYTVESRRNGRDGVRTMRRRLGMPLVWKRHGLTLASFRFLWRTRVKGWQRCQAGGVAGSRMLIRQRKGWGRWEGCAVESRHN